MTSVESDTTGTAALVTGASSGIGEAVAARLVEAGVQVIGFARRAERLDAVAQRLGARFTPCVGDMKNEADIVRAVRVAADAAKCRLWLVNNAGLGHNAPLLSGTTDAWREMLEVNVLGLCVATREAVAQMRARDLDGHVVHISSMAAHRVPSGSGVYSATKFAVRSLTESLRLELWQADVLIRVSSVSPAFVETEFAAQYHRSEAAAEETYGRYKVLSADDVAQSVWFALSQPPEVQVHDILVRPRRQEN